MTDDEIKTMTERFLSWRLPDDFNPDGGITFTPIINSATGRAYSHGPTAWAYRQACAARDAAIAREQRAVADVVAWLRNCSAMSDMQVYHATAAELADAIEAGAHHAKGDGDAAEG